MMASSYLHGGQSLGEVEILVINALNCHRTHMSTKISQD